MPSLSRALTGALTESVQNMIKSGFVLCLDPDYLLLHYGDITVGGRLPESTIGSRYAVCVGVDGEATFWSLLSSGACDYNVKVPDEAKSGPFTKNAKPSYFNPKQLWVMTREMAVESHLQVNGPLRRGFEYSHISASLVPEWPLLPPIYPRNFTKKAHRINSTSLPPSGESIVVNLPQAEVPAASLPPVKVESASALQPIPLPATPITETTMVKLAETVPFDEGAWVRSVRDERGMSRDEISFKTKGFVKQTLLARVERNILHFTADRLDAWRWALRIPETEPNLKRLTLTPGKAEIHRSPKDRARGVAAPTLSALITNPTNCTPIEKTSRETLVADVVRLLSNKRLTDDEACAFGEKLKADIIHLLLGDE